MASLVRRRMWDFVAHLRAHWTQARLKIRGSDPSHCHSLMGRNSLFTHCGVPQPRVKCREARMQKHNHPDTGTSFVCHAFEFTRRLNINRFNMHPLELSSPPAAVNHSLREGERSLAEWMAAVRVHSAQEPILDENPHRGKEFSFSVRYISLWHLKSH